MRSERRHELQRNELADWLFRNYEVIRPYANAILGILLLAALGLAGHTWWTRQSTADTARAWDALHLALGSPDPAELDRVVEEYPDSEVANWARVVSADAHLSMGCQELFTNKAAASQELRKAVENYLNVLESSPKSMIRERATFGLARAYEALAGTRQSQGELDKAIEKYQEVLNNWPQGTYAQGAKRRFEDLQRPATKSFYDEFAAYDPRPAFTDPLGTGERLPFEPGSLTEGAAAPDFSNILGTPDSDEKEEKDESPKEDASSPAEPVGRPPADAGQTVVPKDEVSPPPKSQDTPTSKSESAATPPPGKVEQPPEAKP